MPQEHRHEPLLAGRAAATAHYQLKILNAKLKGIHITSGGQQCTAELSHTKWDVCIVMPAAPIDPDPAKKTPQSPRPTDHRFPMQTGSSPILLTILFIVRDVYLGAYTREPLPSELVRKAIEEELHYSNSKVWALADARQILSQLPNRAIRTRWVICSKSDNEAPDIRARLVACKLRTCNTFVLFLRKHATLGSQSNALVNACQTHGSG